MSVRSIIPMMGNGVQNELLLDKYSGAVLAYSLIQLNSAYTGFCIQVQRTLDYTYRNFGFINGVVDIGGILDFCGSGSGYVSKLYDLIGSNHASISTSGALQMRIVNNGVLEVLSDTVTPAMNQFLNLGTYILSTPITIPTNYTQVLVYERNGLNEVCGLSSGSFPYLYTQLSDGGVYMNNGGSTTQGTNGYQIYGNHNSFNKKIAISYKKSNNHGGVYINDVPVGSELNQGVNSAVQLDRLFNRNDNNYSQKYSSCILFETDLSSQIGPLTRDINYYFNCYSLSSELAFGYNANSNTNDILGVNNATLINGTTYSSGVLGNAFTFDGVNDYVSCPNNFFEPVDSFTLELWVKKNINAEQTFITLTDSSGYRGLRVFVYANNFIAFRIFNSSVGYELSDTTVVMDNSNFYPIHAVSDVNNGMKLYIHGVLVAFNTIKMAIPWGDTTINRIGINYNLASPLQGKIDMIKGWNRVLSQNEITQRINNGIGIE